jgi:hypothetical protein
MSLYFLFACQVDGDARSRVPWREFKLVSTLDGAPLRTWEHIRHELEQRLQCVKDRFRYSACSYISGMLREVYKMCGCKYAAAHRLVQADVVRPGSTVILFRRPPPRYFIRFIPLRYKRVEEVVVDVMGVVGAVVAVQGSTENERIAALSAMSNEALDAHAAQVKQQGKQSKQQQQQQQHPDDYEYDVDKKPVPGVEYLCKGCGAYGEHFRQDCPDEPAWYERGGDPVDEDVIPARAVDKIAVPTGIPKTFLQTVAEAEVDKTTMVTRDGQFVKDVRRSMVEKMADIRAAVVVVVPTPQQEWEDGEEGRFDFEDYLDQVVDVQDAKLAALVDGKRQIQFMCTHWLQGLCHKGAVCDYLHYYDVQYIPICKFYLAGKCTNDPCTFRHILPTNSGFRSKCGDYVRGFCARGKRCPHEHVKREAPCLADFESTQDCTTLFHATVAAFDAFLQEHRKSEVVAKKRYLRAPEVTEMLYSRKKRKKMGVTQ